MIQNRIDESISLANLWIKTWLPGVSAVAIAKAKYVSHFLTKELEDEGLHCSSSFLVDHANASTR